MTNDSPINPSHYTRGTLGIETIDILRDKLSPEEFRGFLKGNILKYLCRAGHKPNNPASQDCKKADWYLNQLIKEFEALEEKK